MYVLKCVSIVYITNCVCFYCVLVQYIVILHWQHILQWICSKNTTIQYSKYCTGALKKRKRTTNNKPYDCPHAPESAPLGGCDPRCLLRLWLVLTALDRRNDEKRNDIHFTYVSLAVTREHSRCPLIGIPLNATPSINGILRDLLDLI